MRRRTFLAGVAAAGVTGALSGCSAAAGAPPRESEVFQTIEWTTGAIGVTLEPTPVVQSRATATATDGGSGNQSSLNPVGVAAAGGRGGRGGRGGSSRGRGSGARAARTGRNGRKKWRSDDDDDEWYEEHDDEIQEYQCAVRTCAIGFVGIDDAYEEDPPGAGPVEWDRQWEDASAGDSVSYTTERQGWYRVGTHLVGAESGEDLGWEAVDFQLVPAVDGGFEVDNQWKISPRL